MPADPAWLRLVVRVSAGTPAFSAHTKWWIKLAVETAREQQGCSVEDFIAALAEGPLKSASPVLIPRYVSELHRQGYIVLVEAKQKRARTQASTQSNKSQASHLSIVCEVCGVPRHPRDRGCASCQKEIPASNDPRWPKWVAHLKAHPELRPSGVRAIGEWTASKCMNVDLWINNDAAPATTIDEIGARRHFMPMD